MDANKALLYLGQFGPYQMYIFALSLLPNLLGGVLLLSNVFLMGTPEHRCLIDGCDGIEHSVYDETWNNFTVPYDGTSGRWSRCQQYTPNDTSLDYNGSALCSKESFSSFKTDCDNWVFDDKEFRHTIIKEWNLVCDDSWLVPLSKAIFMSGVLFGNIICGWCADRYGRKNIFYWAPIGCLLCLIGASFSPNVWVYTVLSAVIAGCSAGMFQTAFVIGIEFIGSSWRAICGNIQSVVFAMGELLLCLMAYYIRDWRKLEFTIMLTTTPLLVLPWVLPESVLWLASRGRCYEAINVIKDAAQFNNIVVPGNILYQTDEMGLRHASLSVKEKHKFHSIDLLKHRLLRRWTLNLCFNWMVNSLVYYGLSLQASSLGSNIYVTFACLAFIEIPFILVGTYTMQVFSRKANLMSFLCIGGTACMLPLVLTKELEWLTPYLAVVGKGTISASFSLIYIYTVEIYPTVLRSTGLGACCMVSRIGGIVAPFLDHLTVYGDHMPLVFCGFVSIIAGLLTMDLPETHNRDLPETIRDIDNLHKGYRSLSQHDDGLGLVDNEA